MSKLKNYYKILEVDLFADESTVKSSFRKLVRQYHPDVNPNDKTAEEKFKLVNEAYETLSDPKKKDFYDKSLKITLNLHKSKSKASTRSKTNSKTTGSAPKAKSKKATEKQSTVKDADGNTTSINDLFDTFFKKGFNSPDNKPPEENFTQSSKKTTTKNKDLKRGKDVTVETEISPNEAVEGTVKTVNVQHNEVCRNCTGTGKVNGSACSTCDGKKYSTRYKKIDVRIPAGVKNGSKVRVANEGGRGENGGKEGDLFLKIKIATDNDLKIEGVDVFGEIEISVLDAILGTSTEVKTMNGRIKMTIPELTPSGKVFRLKEQGIQRGKTKGDHFVTVKITMPDSITNEERELYKKLAELSSH